MLNRANLGTLPPELIQLIISFFGDVESRDYNATIKRFRRTNRRLNEIADANPVAYPEFPIVYFKNFGLFKRFQTLDTIQNQLYYFAKNKEIRIPSRLDATVMFLTFCLALLLAYNMSPQYQQGDYRSTGSSTIDNFAFIGVLIMNGISLATVNNLSYEKQIIKEKENLYSHFPVKK